MWGYTFHIAPYIDLTTEYLLKNFGWFFDAIAAVLLGVERPTELLLQAFPPWVIILFAIALGTIAGGWRLAVICGVCLGFIAISDLWPAAMQTLAAVFTATLLSVLIGIPLGILMGEFRAMSATITPVLDFMQTMPAFVLLIPAVYFFGIGTVGGLVATMVFATPLPVRLTAHGLSMVDYETVEAGQAFGCTRLQLLFLVKLPLAFRSVMAGINQCIMLSLSVVITASFIGAGGLGDEIIRAISRLQLGRGIEAGLAIVGLAIFLDRLSTRVGQLIDPSSEHQQPGFLGFLRRSRLGVESAETTTQTSNAS
jgi:glycine betaine/proline transport system permease protein